MLNPTPVVKSQVMQRISQAPAGKVWTPADFLDLGGRDAVAKNAAADHALALDCARHALMFLNSPDLDLLSARPGTFAITPTTGMVDALRRDYQAMLGMIFGEVPEFSDVLNAVEKLEHEINRRRD